MKKSYESRFNLRLNNLAIEDSINRTTLLKGKKMQVRSLVIFISILILSILYFKLSSFKNDTNTNRPSIIMKNFVEPVTYYVNNDNVMAELNNKLSLHNKVGLVGISGIGKTQTVRMFAHINQERYKLIWFFDSNTDLNEQFSYLAQQINVTHTNFQPPFKLAEDYNNAKNSVMEYLASKNNWLLVFDNLKINQNDKIRDITSWENNGHVIFCSQDAEGFSEIVSLSNLSNNEALRLAEKVLDESINKLSGDLVKEFNNYPFLIVQGAVFLNNNKYMKIEEYKKLLSTTENIGNPNNKIRFHMENVLKNLDHSAQELLFKISLINNHLFSKQLLQIISNFPENLEKDIYNLTRFGLIHNVSNQHNQQQSFEMHDIVKNMLIDMAGEKTNKFHIDKIIDKFNFAFTAKSFEEKYLMMAGDLSNNLEVLLNNAQRFKVSTYKIMSVKEALLDFYMNSRQVYQAKLVIDWLKTQQENKAINLSTMTDKEKSIYCRYLLNVGAYESFYALSNPKIAIQYLEEAKNIISKVEGYSEVKFDVYCQLAQIEAFSGAHKDALKNIQIAEELIRNNLEIKFDLVSIQFTKAKIYLSQQNYKDALSNIDQCIESSNISHNVSDDGIDSKVNTYNSPFFVLKAEILNAKKDFKEAYQIAEKVYLQELNTAKEENERTAFALIQLSRAELGLGRSDKALEYAKKAKEFYINDKTRNNHNIEYSTDFDLADALTAEADALTVLNQKELAIESYNKAEKIYRNRYGEI